MDDFVFHPDVQCFVDRLEYDPYEHEGKIWVHGATSFDGTIALFTRIDKDVRLITVYAAAIWDPGPAEFVDIIYWRRESGEWACRDERKARWEAERRKKGTA